MMFSPVFAVYLAAQYICCIAPMTNANVAFAIAIPAIADRIGRFALAFPLG
jgi:hypothetical protein